MSIKDGGRYEITDHGERGIQIKADERAFDVHPESVAAGAIRQQARDIAELEVFAEIGRQWNTDSSLEKWFPLTADRLGQDAQEIAKLRTDLAAAVSENAALLAANRDLKAHFDALKGDYDEAAHFARHFIRDDAAITPRGAIIRLGDKCTSLFARMKIAETERDEWIACHAQLYRKLGNLLAVIHRDGGHYESEHGTEKACEDAETAVHVMRGCVDGFISSANEWRQRAEQAEARLAAIDSTPAVAHIANKIGPDYFPCGLTILADRKLPPLGTDLIARPAKD